MDRSPSPWNLNPSIPFPQPPASRRVHLTTSPPRKISLCRIYETFDEYASPKQFGWLPHYTADISSVFEIADRPDKTGKCLRQVIARKAQSWAPEWLPYTIIGDRNWADYEVSADVCLDNGGAAGVMGRVNSVGTGYGCVPKGYYLSLAADGTCSLYAPKAETTMTPAPSSPRQEWTAFPAINGTM